MKGIPVFGEFNSAIIASIGALVVGVIMKFASKLTDKRKDALTEHLELRRELREELDAVKAEISTLQKELDVIRIGMMKNRFGPRGETCCMAIDYNTLTIEEADRSVGSIDSESLNTLEALMK